MVKKIGDGVVSLEIGLVLSDIFTVDLLVRQFNNFCHQKIANKQYELEQLWGTETSNPTAYVYLVDFSLTIISGFVFP